MGSIAIAFVVFGWVFGGALLGIFFRKLLPNHHLSADSKDTVKLGMGLVGTMAEPSSSARWLPRPRARTMRRARS